jgi:hypothetical protein
MLNLRSFVGKPFLVKVAGQPDNFACTLQDVDQYGIWITGPGLLRCLGGAGEQLGLLFVSWASLHYLATTELPDNPPA